MLHYRSKSKVREGRDGVRMCHASAHANAEDWA